MSYMSYIPIRMRFHNSPSPFPRSPPPFLEDLITLPLEWEYEEIDDQV
jgi:hypothetical protein